jgi:hypothetical protein
MNLQPSKRLQTTFTKANLQPSPAIYVMAGVKVAAKKSTFTRNHEHKRFRQPGNGQREREATGREPSERPEIHRAENAVKSGENQAYAAKEAVIFHSLRSSAATAATR